MRTLEDITNLTPVQTLMILKLRDKIKEMDPKPFESKEFEAGFLVGATISMNLGKIANASVMAKKLAEFN